MNLIAPDAIINVVVSSMYYTSPKPVIPIIVKISPISIIYNESNFCTIFILLCDIV